MKKAIGPSLSKLLEKAERQRCAGQYVAAFAAAMKVYLLTEASENKAMKINCLLLIAKVHIVRGDLKSTNEVLLRAKADARDCGDEFLLGTTLYMSAYTNKLLGLQSNALADIEQALEIAVALGDPELLYWTYNRAGVVQSDMRRFGIADEFMHRALDLSVGLGDEERFCILNNLTDNIALWEEELSEAGNHLPFSTLSRSLGYGQRALVFARTARNLYREAMVLGNLGLVYGLLKQFDEAFEVLDRSERLATNEGFRGLVLSAAHYRGKVLLIMRDPHKAIHYLQRALQISEAISEDISTRDISRCLASAFETVGDAASALMHYRNYHNFDRQIDNAQAFLKASILIDRVAIMDARLDAKKAREDHDELASRSAALEKSLKTLQILTDEAYVMANTDALTGLYNRHFLEAEFARLRDCEYSDGNPLCVVLIDLDHFKHINDRFGHEVGDTVLREIARIVKRGVPSEGSAIRYGGEEIVILLPNLDLSSAKKLCDDLRVIIKSVDWTETAHDFVVTASFGIAKLRPSDDLVNFLKRADLSLYEAKNSGRDRVCIAV